MERGRAEPHTAPRRTASRCQRYGIPRHACLVAAVALPLQIPGRPLLPCAAGGRADADFYERGTVTVATGSPCCPLMVSTAPPGVMTLSGGFREPPLGLSILHSRGWSIGRLEVGTGYRAAATEWRGGHSSVPLCALSMSQASWLSSMIAGLSPNPGRWAAGGRRRPLESREDSERPGNTRDRIRGSAESRPRYRYRSSGNCGEQPDRREKKTRKKLCSARILLIVRRVCRWWGAHTNVHRSPEGEEPPGRPGRADVAPKPATKQKDQEVDCPATIQLVAINRRRNE